MVRQWNKSTFFSEMINDPTFLLTLMRIFFVLFVVINVPVFWTIIITIIPDEKRNKNSDFISSHTSVHFDVNCSILSQNVDDDGRDVTTIRQHLKISVLVTELCHRYN